MKKVIKWIGIVVGMVVLLAILLVVSLATFVNPNRFKPLLAEKMQQYTGRQLIIEGDLSWTFFPLFGIKTGHVTLKNPTSFDQGIFAEVKDITVSIRLWPLLYKKVESSGIKLDGMKLHLIKNNQGQVNWSFHANTPAAIQPTSSAAHARASAMAVAILGLDIVNSEITWKDEQKKQFINIEKFNLHAKNINLLKPFPITSKFIISNPVKTLQSEVQLKTDVSLNLDAQVFSLRNVEIITHTQQNKQSIKAVMTGDIMADFAKQNLEWENFQAKSDDLTLNGKINIANLMTNPVITGYMEIPSFDLRKWLQDHGRDVTIQGLKKVSGKVDFIPVPKSFAMNGKFVADEFIINHVKLTNLTVPVHYQMGILSLTPISAAFYQGRWNGNVKIDLNTAAPQFTIAANLTQFNVEALIQDLSPKQKLRFAGKGNFDMQVTTQGDDKLSILKNLNGAGHFNVNNGMLKEIDMNHMISSAVARVAKNTTAAENTKQTNFKEVKGSFVIQAGVVNNNDLLMSSTEFITKGEGNINLVNQTINYRLQTLLTAGVLADKMRNTYWYGLPIPVRVEGNLSMPQITLDLDMLTKEIAERQILKVKSQLQERIEKGKIPEKAGKFLQNLLGH